jgi:hypothetical protein
MGREMGLFAKLLSRNKKSKSAEGSDPIKGYGRMVAKKRVVLFLIPWKIYLEGLLQINRCEANKCNRIVFVTINKPAERVIRFLRRHGIDSSKYLFIDAVTGRSAKSTSNIKYISSPRNFKRFKKELNHILGAQKLECFIFDSLSTLLLYKDQNTVIRFGHNLITRLIIANADGKFTCLSRHGDSSLVKGISVFVDKVIDLRSGKRPSKVETTDKIDLISSLEYQLKSFRKAYSSKLLSEVSYFRIKKRIQGKIAKLRK